MRCTQSQIDSLHLPTLTPFRRCRVTFFQTATSHSIASSASGHISSSQALFFPLRTKIARDGDKIPHRLTFHKNGAYRRNYVFLSVYETEAHSASRSSFPSIPEKRRTRPTKGECPAQSVPRRACSRFDTALPELDIKRGKRKYRLNSPN